MYILWCGFEGASPTSTDAEVNTNNVLRSNPGRIPGSSSVWDTTVSSPPLLSQYSLNNQQECLLNSTTSSSHFALSSSCPSSIKGCVAPLLLPNVSLSTVIPSSVKSIRQPVSMLVSTLFFCWIRWPWVRVLGIPFFIFLPIKRHIRKWVDEEKNLNPCFFSILVLTNPALWRQIALTYMYPFI